MTGHCPFRLRKTETLQSDEPVSSTKQLLSAYFNVVHREINRLAASGMAAQAVIISQVSINLNQGTASLMILHLRLQ
jgi:hypothetical protein